MSKPAQIIVRYESPDIEGGFISLDVLGPSLLSLGMLCNRANEVVNGEKVKSTALVNANISQNCFELLFQLDLSLVKDLLNREVAPITILALLGIVSGIGHADAGVIKTGLFDLIKMTQGKNIEKIEILGRHTVIVSIPGNKNKVTIDNRVFNMYGDGIIRSNAQNVINKGLGLSKKSSLTFENRENHEKKTRTTKDYSEFINNGWEGQIKEEYEPQRLKAILSIYSPVFDPEASNWKFLYGEKNKITVDISETSIASDVMKRGGLSVDDRYEIMMELTQYQTKKGSMKNKYKALEVIRFLPAPKQNKIL